MRLGLRRTPDYATSPPIARSLKGCGFTFEALQGIADVRGADGQIERSVELPAYVSSSPLAPKAVAHAAGERLVALGQSMDETFAACVARGESFLVEDVSGLPEGAMPA